MIHQWWKGFEIDDSISSPDSTPDIERLKAERDAWKCLANRLLKILEQKKDIGSQVENIARITKRNREIIESIKTSIRTIGL